MREGARIIIDTDGYFPFPLCNTINCPLIGDSMSLNNGMKFSTPGAENNEPSSTKCVDNYGVGWWYNESKNCTSVLPTASFGSYPGISENNGIMWSNPWGSKKFAKFVTMMIRPN